MIEASSEQIYSKDKNPSTQLLFRNDQSLAASFHDKTIKNGNSLAFTILIR